MEEISNLLAFDTAGDPMTGRKWTRMTPTKVAECLQERLDIGVSATTVRRLLTQLDYALKGNRKTLAAGSHPDRDTPCGIIRRLREQCSAAGEPIISVDTKKKELIGLFKNPGRTWCREARPVRDHDVRSEALGIAAPYGVYDVGRHAGVIVVGKSADTPEFAVNAIATWWQRHGRYHSPASKRLLVLANSGGRNGARPRAFKKCLQERIADAHGLEVTVCHYPTGASKWHPIEHRMFSEISKNWAGHPLESFATLLNFARDTTTETGLRIAASLDEREYEKGITVPDKEFKRLNMTKNADLSTWNYTIRPRLTPIEEALRPPGEPHHEP
ncbi:MAG: ISAzo13 family transposase [Candidatus Methylomirabilales bacterium]